MRPVFCNLKETGSLISVDFQFHYKMCYGCLELSRIYLDGDVFLGKSNFDTCHWTNKNVNRFSYNLM